MKRFNMKRVNRDAPRQHVEIECGSKVEADKLVKKVLNYIERIRPSIERASFGYATNAVDVRDKMNELVLERNLSSSRGAKLGLHAVLKQKERFEGDAKRKYAPTLTVTYSSGLGQ